MQRCDMRMVCWECSMQRCDMRMVCWECSMQRCDMRMVCWECTCSNVLQWNPSIVDTLGDR